MVDTDAASSAGHSSPERVHSEPESETDSAVEVKLSLGQEAEPGPKRALEPQEGTLHKLASLKAQPGSHHHFSDVETVQLATFINARFADEPLLSGLLPVDGTNPDTFFDAWGDGMLLMVLVDAACEGAVDLEFRRRRAAKPLGVSVRHLTIQHFAVLNEALAGCKNIDGLRLGFVGAEDFVQGNRPVILGVGWQLVRLAILQKVNVFDRPELEALFTPEEAEKKLGRPGQEELVLSRWFNQYLQAVGSDRQVWSFGAELADGVAWCTLLNAIDPAACPPPDDLDDAANVSNVINAVHKMGVKGVFLTEIELMDSDKKQNVMFCAQIMDAYPTLPTRLQHSDTRTHRSSSHMSRKKNVGGGDSFYSSLHSKDSSTVASSSIFLASPLMTSSRDRDVDLSAAPMVAPPSGTSPPKSGWGFGMGLTDAGEGKIYYDSDGEVDNSGGCGLGGFGWGSLFACVTRN